MTPLHTQNTQSEKPSHLSTLYTPSSDLAVHYMVSAHDLILIHALGCIGVSYCILFYFLLSMFAIVNTIGVLSGIPHLLVASSISIEKVIMS